MQRRSFVITAALVAGLLLGIVLGPSVRGLSASAQTPTPAPSRAPAQTRPATPNSGLFNLFLDQLAAALNIQRSALDSAITSTGNSTADTAVQQGTLTQAQADALKARVQSGDLGALWGGRGRHGGGPRVAGVQQAMLDAAARTLSITTDELVTQLRSGQTVAQLAQAHNTTEQAVIDAALAAAKTRLDQAVASSTLTQAQADTIYAELQQRGAQILAPRGGKHRSRDGQTAPGTPGAPTAPTAPAGTSGA